MVSMFKSEQGLHQDSEVAKKNPSSHPTHHTTTQLVTTKFRAKLSPHTQFHTNFLPHLEQINNLHHCEPALVSHFPDQLIES